MTEPTDEMFAEANVTWFDAGPYRTPADAGRAMFAALQAHGCIPQQQGLTVRQELVARLVCSSEWSVEGATEAADKILALGDTK